MNKILIPTILAATILVAASFALMPVQRATTTHLPSVTGANIADNSITSAKIAPNTIVAADIAPDTITAAELADAIALDAALSITGNTIQLGTGGTAFVKIVTETTAAINLGSTVTATEIEVICSAAQNLATDIGTTDLLFVTPTGTLGATFVPTTPNVTYGTPDTIEICVTEKLGTQANADPDAAGFTWKVFILDL